jgi:hypothetical protein
VQLAAEEAAIQTSTTSSTSSSTTAVNTNGDSANVASNSAIAVKQKMLSIHSTHRNEQRRAIDERYQTSLATQEAKRVQLQRAVDDATASGDADAMTRANTSLTAHVNDMNTITQMHRNELTQHDDIARHESDRINTALSSSLTTADYAAADTILSELRVPLTDNDHDENATAALSMAALLQRRRHIRVLQRANILKQHRTAVMNLNKQLADYRVELQKWVCSSLSNGILRSSYACACIGT